MAKRKENILRFDGGHGLAVLAILGVLIVLFWTAPLGGEFSWSDAPRHALNGVFIKDLVVAMPLKDLEGFAYGYYAKYPALTILFYPPLFYFLSAPFYGLLGASYETALFVVFLHYVMLGLGCYRLGLYWFRPSLSLALALTLLVVPEIAFWGRQIMLEVPAFAFLVWSAVAFMQYLRGQVSRYLYLTALLLLLAIYTKISVAFLGLTYVAVLLLERGPGIFKDRNILICGALTFLGLIPLMIMTFKFGRANLQSVINISDSMVSRATLGGWLWYARQLPNQLGWALLTCVIASFAYAIWRRSTPALARRDWLFWGLWFLSGYIFFSAIDLKEARHSIFILLPMVFIVFLVLARYLTIRWALLLGFGLFAVTFAQTLASRPVLFVQGYAEAVDKVAKLAPKGSVVLFSGNRDGSFIFNLRVRDDRRDLSVMRADKMLLRVAVRRELGVEQKTLNEAEIAAMINRQGVDYVVMEPGFWTDLEVMRRFERVMQSPQFELVERVPIHANFPVPENELLIYRNRGPVSRDVVSIPIELPIIGRVIQSGVERQ
jgi:4-amino-4-deoxy-L-arabinose transferase-like glycosyltransferase